MTKIISSKNILDIKKYIEGLDTDIVLICVDHRVYSKYSKLLELENIKSKKILIYKASDGEKSKTFSEFENCHEYFLSKGIHRKAHLVAIGGGALSDLAGFVASTILRGISWSVIPTSLLAMIDASIGGKVAINTKEYKNLVGAFHLPTAVIIYSKFLETLPEIEKLSGLGELVKYCFLDKKIYSMVNDKEDLEKVIMKCAEYKQQVVEADLKESDKRKILNLGHTFGHAIERIYKIHHGIAVVWGLVIIFQLFEKNEMLKKFKTIISKLGFENLESPWLNKTFPLSDIIIQIEKDKKKSSLESIDIVICEKIGEVEVQNISFEELKKRLLDNEKKLRSYVV